MVIFKKNPNTEVMSGIPYLGGGGGGGGGKVVTKYTIQRELSFET